MSLNFRLYTEEEVDFWRSGGGGAGLTFDDRVESRVQCLGFRVRVHGLRFRVQGSGFRG